MVPPAGTSAYQDLLIAHLIAWSRHDVDAIMGTMTQDCVFETLGGPDPWGRRYEGHVAVREAIDWVRKLLARTPAAEEDNRKLKKILKMDPTKLCQRQSRR